MDYKKIVKNENTRLLILKSLRFVPNRFMLRMQYRIKMGRKLNLTYPKRWTEKLQLYKLNYKTPIITKCSDKYEVREYIESKGLSKTLTKLYQVHKNPEDIDFSRLPNKFVIKTNNGSGTNIFCTDKSKLDVKMVSKKLRNWIKRDYYAAGREWAYKNIHPKLIIEEFLEDESNKFEGINDYKILCFNGKPKYIIVDVDRHIDHKRNIYNLDWELQDISSDYPNFNSKISKPKKLNELLDIASKLSKDFPFVRVDLYIVNEVIYFGELTFYPWTGYVQFTPDSFDYILGQLFTYYD